MSPSPCRTLALSLLLAAPLAAQQKPLGKFEDEEKLYQESLGYRAFYLRGLCMERFAKTADLRALGALLKRYQDPDDPQDHMRYLIAGVIGDQFKKPEALQPILELTSRLDRATDAWMWWQALRLQAQKGDATTVSAIAGAPKRDPFIRAAALEALGVGGKHDLSLEVIAQVLAPEAVKKLKGHERLVLLESCSWALAAAKVRAESEAFKKAAELVIAGLDDKKLEQRSRVVVCRALSRALDSPTIWLQSEPWLQLLRQGKKGEEKVGETRARISGRTTPRFLGIEGIGLRFAFVIDLSDSMMIPLSQEELAELRRVPTGGINATEARKKKDFGLPWDKITTRFDIAREALKVALLSLDEEMSFGVVMFGTKAETLLGPSLLEATPKNVARAIEALDAIKSGPAKDGRPHGTLKGFTNIHGALRMAYRLTAKEPIASIEHVAPAGFVTGCDTIFLLSDGAPSWDDFDCNDVRVEWMRAGDPEDEKAKGKDVKELHYYGPYAEPRLLVRDLERMNQFRRAEVHAIAIGEADPLMLEEIVKMCHGELKRIGTGKK